MAFVICPVCGEKKKSLSRHLAWSSSCSAAFIANSSCTGGAGYGNISSVSRYPHDGASGSRDFGESSLFFLDDSSHSVFGFDFFPGNSFDADSIRSPTGSDILEEDEFGDYHAAPIEHQPINQRQVFVPFGSGLMFEDKDKIVQVELMKLLKDLRAPLYAYDSIMQWAADTTSLGHVFSQQFMLRETVLVELIRHHNMTNVAPQLISVDLEDGRSVDVVTFDFTQMVYSLFSDRELMQPDNFCVNIADLCRPPLPVGADDIIESFVHTTSYRSAYRRLVEQASDIIFPIQFFIDKSHVTENGKLHLEPVLFTFTFFLRKLRTEVAPGGRLVTSMT